MNRAMKERISLIGKKPYAPDSIEREYAILGSVGNVYIVKICKSPSCSCQDFTKGHFCKHILFVYLKVLKVPITSPLIYQRALLSTELQEIFVNAPTDPSDTILATSTVREKFAELVSPQVRRREVSDDCLICYDNMRDASELIWCANCGNNVHRVCFKDWEQTCQKKVLQPTCILCRAPWKEGTSKSDIKIPLVDGYLNLAQYDPNCPTTRKMWGWWRDVDDD